MNNFISEETLVRCFIRVPTAVCQYLIATPWRLRTVADSLTAPSVAVMTSHHSQSVSHITQQDVLSLKTLMPRSPRP